MSSKDDRIQQLRQQLSALDSQLLELVGKRLELARKIGQYKHAGELELRDIGREHQVMALAQSKGELLGLPPGLAEDILRRLMDSALELQEQQKYEHRGSEQLDEGTGASH